MNDACVFCRIVSGRLPSERVLDTPDVLAFLDIGPIVKGHVLVIPKAHFPTLPEMPPETWGRVAAAARQVAGGLLRGLQADGVNVFQANGASAGQVVPHVHVHVIPRFDNDGHHWNWASCSYVEPGEAARFGERIRAALR